MRIDIHTHIFPPEFIDERDRFFPGEPIFKLLYGSPTARLATAETLLEIMDRDAVDIAVTFGFPWRNPELAYRHNDYVLEAASKYSRLVPLGCVNPLGQGSLQEANRCLRSGAKGLGELAIYDECDKETALNGFRELVESCRSHGGILLVHANEPVGHWYPGKATLGLDFFYALARLTAEMPLILAHWGGGLCFYELLKKDAPEVLKHVYYDTAASPFLYRPDVYRIMARTLDAEKLLFGSDFPLLPPRRYFQDFSEAGLTADEIRAISGENAARLFNLTVRPEPCPHPPR